MMNRYPWSGARNTVGSTVACAAIAIRTGKHACEVRPPSSLSDFRLHVIRYAIIIALSDRA